MLAGFLSGTVILLALAIQGQAANELVPSCRRDITDSPRGLTGSVPEEYGEVAVELWLKAKAGDWGAQNDLGLRLEKGDGAPKDIEMALCWMMQAADNPLSIGPMDGAPETTLGWWYLSGEHSPTILANDELAFHWNTKGANQGHPGAMVNLALMYAVGLGVEQSYVKTEKLLLKALNHFSEAHMFMLLFDEDDWQHFSRAKVPKKYIYLKQNFEDAIIRKSLLFPSKTLSSIAFGHRRAGRYAKALEYYVHSLAILEEAHSSDPDDVARNLSRIGLVYFKQQEFALALGFLKRSLAIRKKALGPNHPRVALSLEDVAIVYSEQGQYAQALKLLRRSLAIREKVQGLTHPEVGECLGKIADVYSAQGNYTVALDLHTRSLQIQEKALGPDHPSVAEELDRRGQIYRNQSRYADALETFQRSLAIRNKVLGPEHLDVAISLNKIAGVYSMQGLDHALELYRRSLAIREKALGPYHPKVGYALANFASAYYDLAPFEHGRREYALAMFQRSLAITEEAFGSEHPNLAYVLDQIGSIYSDQRRWHDALEMHQRSLEIREKVSAPNNFGLASTLTQIGYIYSDKGNLSKALVFLHRSLAVMEKSRGAQHFLTSTALNNLASVYSKQGLYEDALGHVRRATNIRRRRFVGLGSKESKGLLSEQRDSRWGFYKHIDLALHPEQTDARVELEAEAFEVMQLASTSSAGSALAQMAVRFASGSDGVSDLVRQFQDAALQFEALDGNLIKAISAAANKRNDILIGNLRRQLGDIKTRIEALDGEIEEKFPEYTALTSREPLSVGGVQKLLGPDEALITFIRSGKRDKTHVFVVRQKEITVYTVDVELDELRKSVDTLRSSLDLSVVGSLGNLPPFDTTVAFELYDKLLGPAAPALEGVKHLFVVPTGPLQSLPLGVLVTRRPATSGPDVPANDNGNRLQTRGLVTVPGKEAPVVEADNKELAARYGHYRNVPWLAKRYALTTLPTVASLKSLRTFAKRSKASKPFAGFGDPVLDGNAGRRKGVEITAMFRGALANVDEVRKLSRLPDTADELRSMAQYLGADDGSVFLGSRATEAQVKRMNLSDRRVVAFSTHGLVSGELKYLAEPALVLTPPDKATDQDDGLLTASEIAQLKLDADWVILSACNTAHADKPGAQGLSGLAKAFFYAGSRALLVSHWPVESRSATALTEDLFREFEENPDIGRAEALRRSMLNVATNDNHPQWAHPAYWAPFVVVGEGLWR
jgi:CHAT domain-containing protein